MTQLEQVGYFPAGEIPLSNNKMVINEMSTISTDITRRRKWKASKISPFEDMVVDEYLSGSSLSQIRRKLAAFGVCLPGANDSSIHHLASPGAHSWHDEPVVDLQTNKPRILSGKGLRSVSRVTRLATMD